jgi:hypothetical protein
VLHLRKNDKEAEFMSAVENKLKLKSYDFRGTFLPATSLPFREHRFYGKAYSFGAIFSGKACA